MFTKYNEKRLRAVTVNGKENKKLFTSNFTRLAPSLNYQQTSRFMRANILVFTDTLLSSVHDHECY